MIFYKKYSYGILKELLFYKFNCRSHLDNIIECDYIFVYTLKNIQTDDSTKFYEVNALRNLQNQLRVWL